MSTKPAAPVQGRGNYHDDSDSELQSVRGAAADGGETAGIISSMAAHDEQTRRVSLMLPAYEAAGDEHKEHSAVRRKTVKSIERISTLSVAAIELGLDGYAGPRGVALPPPGSTYVRPEGRAALAGKAVLPLPTLGEEGSRVVRPPRTRKTIERVSTLAVATRADTELGPAPPSPPHLRRTLPPRRKHRRGESRPVKAKRPVALCYMVCCILLCLLVIATSLALVVVYLPYHHHLQPPRMRVTTATLLKNSNSNSIAGSGQQEEANYSLTIQAEVYNPNTKLHMVLRDMPLDLYFDGSLIGTGAVSPVLPIHKQAPGDSSSVQLLGSVAQLEKDAAAVAAWRKATDHNHGGGGVPLELRLAGTFQAQLDVGRWLPSFRFRVYPYPRCTLWLDPTPVGALRRSRCLPEYLTK